MNQQQLEEAYLKSLDDKNRKALEMAKQLLGSTYNLRKSIGFLEWKENNKV